VLNLFACVFCDRLLCFQSLSLIHGSNKPTNSGETNQTIRRIQILKSIPVQEGQIVYNKLYFYFYKAKDSRLAESIIEENKDLIKMRWEEYHGTD